MIIIIVHQSIIMMNSNYDEYLPNYYCYDELSAFLEFHHIQSYFHQT